MRPFFCRNIKLLRTHLRRCLTFVTDYTVSDSCLGTERRGVTFRSDKLSFSENILNPAKLGTGENRCFPLGKRTETKNSHPLPPSESESVNSKAKNTISKV